MNKKTKKSRLLAVMAMFTFVSSLSLTQLSSESNQFLSAQSMEQLTALNQQYDLEMKPIGVESGSFNNQLLTADLLSDAEIDNEHPGLILSMNKEGKANYFRLTPNVPFSDEKTMKEMVELYQKIPEINAEVDQEVVISSTEEQLFFSGNDLNIQSQDQYLNPLDHQLHEPVRIGVIDTGIDETHELFKNTLIEPGWNAIDGNTDTSDEIGHGSHITGIIANQVQVPVAIYPLKVVSKEAGNLSHVIEALEVAKDMEIDIVNMSFGFKEDSKILSDALESLFENQENQMVVVAAAGNHGSNQRFYPAAYSHDQIISVGAIFNTWTYHRSNYGDWVEVASPGVHIRSAWLDGEYVYRSGTSQAAPHFSAYVANRWNEGDFKGVVSEINQLKEDHLRVTHGTLKDRPIF